MEAMARMMDSFESMVKAEVEKQVSERVGTVYKERDMCVSLIARMARACGYDAWIGQHDGANWDDDWRNIVFIQLPAGQVSWHIHDSELKFFDFLSKKDTPWDGHTTDEKYHRVLSPLLFPEG